MKILHTSDWHLGHEFYNYKRKDEFVHFFSQLRQIIVEQQPDAMLVSGDVYHSTVPDIATQTMYTETMLTLHEACPEMEIVVTAGNHDSASRLEIDRSLWSRFHVRVVGGLSRSADGVCYDDHVFRIGDKGFVVAVPHVFKQNFPPAKVEGEDRQTAFFKSLMQYVTDHNAGGLPVVLMAHLAVDHSSERKVYAEVGDMVYEDVGVLADGYDYAALGHIHRPSQVPSASTRVRYCGSPLAITFNEEYEHSVSIVEVEHGQAPVVTPVPIVPLRGVRTVPDGAVSFAEALELLSELPDSDPSYIRVNVLADEGLPPDAVEQALRATENKACRFCLFQKSAVRKQRSAEETFDVTPTEFLEMSPVELARRYLEFRGDVDNVEELLDMMKETLDLMEMEESK